MATKREVNLLCEKMDERVFTFSNKSYQIRLGTFSADHDDPTVRIQVGSADAGTDELDEQAVWVSPSLAKRIADELYQLADDVKDAHWSWTTATEDTNGTA